VYPVVSRRAGGLSVGINLNTNNACNWRCVYCQVPDLVRGAAPAVDLALLERELREFLEPVLHGDFLERQVPPGLQRLNDIALSGNGEPTSCRDIEAVIALIQRVRREQEVPDAVKTILITNGSLMHRRSVQAALRRMAEINGEIWFKLDRATTEGIQEINDVRTSIAAVRRKIEIAASLCPTWIQTCVFAIDGRPPPAAEIDAYLAFLGGLHRDRVPLRGVLLYGIARPSQQPEAPRLSALPAAWLEDFARQIEATGFPVRVSV
jgi:wyosine [tRNA(Phe)-imidazoG37] synthetase (radical SAM superfamily)